MKEYIFKDDFNLEKVCCYLEVFYYFCEVEEWEKVGEFVFIELEIFI